MKPEYKGDYLPEDVWAREWAVRVLLHDEGASVSVSLPKRADLIVAYILEGSNSRGRTLRAEILGDLREHISNVDHSLALARALVAYIEGGSGDE